MHIGEKRICATLAAALQNLLSVNDLNDDDVRRALEASVRALEELADGAQPFGGEPIEAPEAWSAFLAGHPEIAGARIGDRSHLLDSSPDGLAHFDAVADREFVHWPRFDGGDEYQLASLWLTGAQLVEALSRRCRRERRPVTAQEVACELWGPDANPAHVGAIGGVLSRSANVTTDRSTRPNRYHPVDG